MVLMVLRDTRILGKNTHVCAINRQWCQSEDAVGNVEWRKMASTRCQETVNFVDELFVVQHTPLLRRRVVQSHLAMHIRFSYPVRDPPQVTERAARRKKTLRSQIRVIVSTPIGDWRQVDTSSVAFLEMEAQLTAWSARWLPRRHFQTLISAGSSLDERTIDFLRAQLDLELAC